MSQTSTSPSLSKNSNEMTLDATKDMKSQAPAHDYPGPKKRIVIMTAVYLAVFLVTLDQNIISTAIPRITDQFHSLNDVGWYGTAYLLTMCSFQLVMGKVYKFYPTKPVFITFCILFEIGSAICGAAPNSTAFIIGRAIAGLGSSGMFQGCMVIIFHTIPLQQRPIFQGLFGAVFALASVVGPLVGGTFTDKVTWRWCFYINLPVGAISILVTTLVLRLPGQKLDAQGIGLLAKLKQLDPIGNLAFFPGIVCLVLALQWGGTQYAWSNWRIIVLLVICAILCLSFVVIQIWKKEDATVPPRIVKQRSMLAALWFGFFQGGAMMTIVYYLPIWFQAVKGASALHSGIMLLPLVLSTVVGTISSGIITSKIGYYTPFFVISSVMTPCGAGILATFTPETGHAKWIGAQVLIGLGLGWGAQQPLNVAQTVLSRSDASTGSAIIMFTRFLGSAIFIPVAQNIFLNQLVSKLTNLPGVSASAIIGGGATELKNLVSAKNYGRLLQDYNAAVVDVFYLVIAASSVTILGSVFVEWRSLKAEAAKQQAARAPVSETEKVPEVKETAEV